MPVPSRARRDGRSRANARAQVHEEGVRGAARARGRARAPVRRLPGAHAPAMRCIAALADGARTPAAVLLRCAALQRLPRRLLLRPRLPAPRLDVRGPPPGVRARAAPPAAAQRPPGAGRAGGGALVRRMRVARGPSLLWDVVIARWHSAELSRCAAACARVSCMHHVQPPGAECSRSFGRRRGVCRGLEASSPQTLLCTSLWRRPACRAWHAGHARRRRRAVRARLRARSWQRRIPMRVRARLVSPRAAVDALRTPCRCAPWCSLLHGRAARRPLTETAATTESGVRRGVKWNALHRQTAASRDTRGVAVSRRPSSHCLWCAGGGGRARAAGRGWRS